jgi:glycosyltransferase involved in cell wall biosynthesis
VEQDQFDDVSHPALSILNVISPIGRRPLVSVLTPSFGQAAWLGDNLRSVQAQTYPAIEHIVMDGGSNDGTLDVLRREAGARVAWWSEPDEGQSHALNKAFNESRGEIIGWLNSDDAYFGPTVVEEAVEVFAADPRVAVVYGHALLADADGRILQVIWTPPFSRTLLRLHDFILQPAAFIRRSVLSGTLVDESFDYSMDYELWLRLAQRHRFQRLDRIIAIDRHHLARKSYTMLDVGRADHVRLSQRYGVARGTYATVGRKAWKIVSRAAGVRLITAATEESVVFSARRDSRARLLLRQLTAPRAAMRSGNG